MNYQKLRLEAEAEARKILGKTKKLGKKDLSSKESITKTFKRSKHVLLKQSDIDHCVNNGMDVMYLYDELLSKYGGLEDKPKKQYYVPRGGKRGRPKDNKNEQEQ
jgi:hypothetical protein